MPLDYNAPRQSNLSKIAEIRMEKGITQRELAEAIGANFRLITMWENGTAAPSVRYLDRIAKVLDVDIRILIDNQPKKRYPNNIAKYRKAIGMSQQQLADAVGIKQGTISAYETGAMQIPEESLKRIAEVLGAKPSEIGNAKETQYMSPITEYRKRANLTQTELAEKCGFSLSTITNYEVGRTKPSASRLKKIADALNVPVEKLEVQAD